MQLRSPSGQAAVEYLAVVGVVAGVLLVAGVALGGRAVAAATLAQVQRALCVATGRDCAEVRPACALDSRRNGRGLSLDLAVVHLGGGTSAVVERRSDGRVLVTVGEGLEAGLSAGVGAGAGAGSVHVGGELRAAAIARRGNGTTYEVASERQADALLRLLRRPHMFSGLQTPAVAAYWRRVEAVLPRVPPPVARYSERGGGGSLTAALGIGRAGASAELLSGAREDLRSGRRTVYLKGSASLDVGLRAAGAGAIARGSARAQIAITRDRAGHPLDLALLGAGALGAAPDLPALLRPLAGRLPGGKGRSWELESHMDLTQPGAVAVARALVATLGHGGEGAALRRVLAASAIQVRSYGTAHRETGLGGHLEAGIGAGATLSHTADSARLLTAMERRAGLWVPRLDCLAAL